MTLKKSQKFFYGCLAFLIGVAIGEAWNLQDFLFGMILISLAIAFFFIPKQKILIVFAALLFFGVFWNNFFNPTINSKHISFYNGKSFTFEAKISGEPDVRIDQQKLTVKPAEYNGLVLVTTSLYPEYDYGDLLKIKCKLLSPADLGKDLPKDPENISNDFQYDKYLGRYHIFSVCYQPEIKVVAKNKGNPVIAAIFKIKSVVEEKINKTLPEPEAGLAAGILIGSRKGIPADLLAGFNTAGITHIIAISGYNISIIVALLMNLAKTLCISRKKATWGIFIGLAFFVILTGMSGSVMRAAIMGGIVIFAKHIGRPSKIRNVLILSAALMILFNPKILIWDAGFQLSFLSTIGLIYLSPALEKYLAWLPEKLAIRSNLTSTLSAIIFTLPMILFNFHRLSIVAPVVNLLVLPAIPIAMLTGFLQVVGSFVFPFLGQFIGWFTWLLLAYVVEIVRIFSKLSWAAAEIRIDWWLMGLLYLIIGIFIYRFKKQQNIKTSKQPVD
ncbi:MAG: ComEC/Rec2 family competence protein [Parcubacteria group bacterium]